MPANTITLSELTHTDLGLCECAACTGGVHDQSQADFASLDPQAGGTANNKPIWTAEQAATYLNRTGGGYANTNRDLTTDGRQNNIGDDNSVITFGFFNTIQQVYANGYTYTANNAQGVPTLYGLSEAFNFAAFTEAQRSAAREAFQYWDDLVAISFKEVSADDADMNFGNLASAPTTQAYARIPTAGLDATIGGQVREIGGDSWYSASQASNFQLDEGLYGMNTLTHEIGHGLGLSHPGAYNFGPGFAVTYANGAEYAQDARNYSIMSYWNPRDLREAGGNPATRDFDWSLMSIAYGATPMVHDILAIQRIYGADTTTRTGDNTYGFNASGVDIRDAHDFVKTPWPTMAIWDAGGIDTLDASKYNVEQVIDLTPGSLSSIGGINYDERPSFAQVNANRAAAGLTAISQATYDLNMALFAQLPDFRGRLTDNVGIAYGTTIENAEGGSRKDTIIGNDADNRLNGNAGDDVLSGNAGNDTLNGGSGADSLSGGVGNDTLNGGTGADSMSGGVGNDVYFVDDAADLVTELLGEGTDTVSVGFDYALGDNLENLELTGAARRGTGNALDNLIVANGNLNVIDGGAGFDVVSYRNAGSGVKVSLQGKGADGDAKDDEYRSIEGVEGSNFADVLGGTDGSDYLGGLGGNDLLEAGNGDDRLDGGDGDDHLKGDNGRDSLLGGDGNDFLEGGNEVDVLDGGAGSDRLDGGNEGDRLNGGAGNDYLIGGNGKDTFVFADAGVDTIADYKRGEKIDLSAFGIQVENVTVQKGRIFVDLDGDTLADLTIYVNGDSVNPTDIVFG